MACAAPWFVDGDGTLAISGNGKRATQRLASEFDIWCARGFGGVLRIVIQGDAAPHASDTAGHIPNAVSVEYGAISLALGGQAVHGGAWTCTQGVERFTAMIADGLGHGLLAAAVAATGSLPQGSGAPPSEVVSVVHHALRSTVGAALEGVRHFC
jgi:hypothetical protein